MQPNQREQTAATILAALIESYDLMRNGGRTVEPVLQGLADQAVRLTDYLRYSLANTKSPNPNLVADAPERAT